MEKKKVVVLGASDKQERYSYKALKLLLEHGYDVIPIHPILERIEGTTVIKNLGDIQAQVYTLTVYVGVERIKPLISEIIALKPQRVILNPGTESDDLKKALKEASIPYLEACTLILLNTGQFEKALY